MMSLSGEALPAQCIVHFVLVNILFCRLYPMLKSLCFSGVVQNLAVSQTGDMTRKCSEKNFKAQSKCVNPSSKSVATYFSTGYAILFDSKILVEVNL